MCILYNWKGKKWRRNSQKVGREQSHSSLRLLLRRNKWKTTLCLQLCQKQSQWGHFVKMKSHITTNKVILFPAFYYHESIIILNYSYHFSPFCYCWYFFFFYPIIKPLSLTSHCLFSVLLSPWHKGHFVFHFQQVTQTPSGEERYWETKAFPSALYITEDEVTPTGITFSSDLLSTLKVCRVFEGRETTCRRT